MTTLPSTFTRCPQRKLLCCERAPVPMGARLPQHGLGARDGERPARARPRRGRGQANLDGCFLGVLAGGRGSRSQLWDSAQPGTQDLLGPVLEFGGEKAF